MAGSRQAKWVWVKIQIVPPIKHPNLPLKSTKLGGEFTYPKMGCPTKIGSRMGAFTCPKMGDPKLFPTKIGSRMGEFTHPQNGNYLLVFDHHSQTEAIHSETALPGRRRFSGALRVLDHDFGRLRVKDQLHRLGALRPRRLAARPAESRSVVSRGMEVVVKTVLGSHFW